MSGAKYTNTRTNAQDSRESDEGEILGKAHIYHCRRVDPHVGELGRCDTLREIHQAAGGTRVGRLCVVSTADRSTGVSVVDRRRHGALVGSRHEERSRHAPTCRGCWCASRRPLAGGRGTASRSAAARWRRPPRQRTQCMRSYTHTTQMRWFELVRAGEPLILWVQDRYPLGWPVKGLHTIVTRLMTPHGWKCAFSSSGVAP